MGSNRMMLLCKPIVVAHRVQLEKRIRINVTRFTDSRNAVDMVRLNMESIYLTWPRSK